MWNLQNMWEAGEKGQLKKRLHRIVDMEECGSLNRKRMHLSWFISVCGNCMLIPYLDWPQHPLSLFLAWLLWESCLSGLAVPDQNLCWWPQRGPFWCTTIFLAFSHCPCITHSFLLPSATTSPPSHLPLVPEQTESWGPLHAHLQFCTTVFIYCFPPSLTFLKPNTIL